jgi:hypothetical protein
MYTPRRLRYATRWNRRLLFALAVLLLLFVTWLPGMAAATPTSTHAS